MDLKDLRITSDFSETPVINAAFDLKENEELTPDLIQKKIEENKTIEERLGYKPIIVFCFTENNFSQAFLQCWTRTINYLYSQDLKFILGISLAENQVIAKNSCLGGRIDKGKSQKPFQEQIEYTHICFINSNMIWGPEALRELLLLEKDIVSAIYTGYNEKVINAVKKCDFSQLLNQKPLNFIEKESIKEEKDLVEVEYTAMNFILIKRQVIETLEYPWFRCETFQLSDEISDILPEQFYFCKKVRENNFKIFIDPKIAIAAQFPVPM